MKHLLTLSLVLLMGGCLSVSQGSGSASSPGEAVVRACDDAAEVNVLFLGNSYTSYNNLPMLFSNLACSGGYNVSVSSNTAEPRFSAHEASTQTINLLSSKQWDYVVLQDHPLEPGYKPAEVTSDSLQPAKDLVAAVKVNSPAVEIIYFVTWGSENGDTDYNCNFYPDVCDFDGHTTAILAGYTQYKDGTGGKLAKVGSAWKDVVDGPAPFGSSDLWISNGDHPDVKGSYLAAAVIFATIFNQSPVGLDGPSGLNSVDVNYMNGIAGAQLTP